MQYRKRVKLDEVNGGYKSIHFGIAVEKLVARTKPKHTIQNKRLLNVLTNVSNAAENILHQNGA